MNLFKDFEGRVLSALEALERIQEKKDDISLSRVSVEPPRDPSHGDVATNAAMVLAKSLGTNPRALADEISGILEKDTDIERISVAGPGFINMKLSAAYWQRTLSAMIAEWRELRPEHAG